MSLDIHLALTTNVPQLDGTNALLRELGAQLMDRLDAINQAIADLGTQQAAGSEAIAAQLTAIADEINQLSAGSITDAELQALEQNIRQAATTAAAQAASIRANTQQITTIVPDPPPTP